MAERRAVAPLCPLFALDGLDTLSNLETRGPK